MQAITASCLATFYHFSLSGGEGREGGLIGGSCEGCIYKYFLCIMLILCLVLRLCYPFVHLTPVVQMVDRAIHQINHYPSKYKY